MEGPEDEAKAGEVLRATVWTTLYLTVTTRTPPHAAQSAPAALPPCGPRVPGSTPSTTLTNRLHTSWPARSVLPVWHLRPLMQRLCHSGPQATAANNTDAVGTNRPIAAGDEHPTGPCSPHINGLSPLRAQTIYTAHTTGCGCDASGPPPYPCSRCQGNHWSWQACPTRQANIPPQPQFAQQSKLQPQPQPQH